jgi:hypothetical protein
MREKIKEIVSEFSIVFEKRSTIDIFVIPTVFILVMLTFNLKIAITFSFIISLVTFLYRSYKKEGVKYSLVAIVGTFIFYILLKLSGEQKLFFAPAIVTSLITSLLCMTSIIIGKPLVAYTSFLARKWPIDWYWHPKVKPAYTQVTAVWFLYFTLRLIVQTVFLFSSSTKVLSTVITFLGWPSTLILLVFSYIFGSWRLKALGGPSVKEFTNNAKPPWKGQQTGF